MVRKIIFAAFACFALIAFNSIAFATTIQDTYWGGTVVNAGATQYGDVLQEPGTHAFEVNSVNVTMTGRQMTITFSGGYFSPGNTERSSYGPGDLYISSQGWKVSNTSDPTHFSTDTFRSSEGWNYVISSNGKVYSLNYNSIIMSGGTPDEIYRSNQAWRGGYGTFIENATVSLNSDSTMSFTFDTAPLGLSNDFGIHWTMACGNDVVEGRIPIATPEPSCVLLLGLTFVGIGVGKKFLGRNRSLECAA